MYVPTWELAHFFFILEIWQFVWNAIGVLLFVLDECFLAFPVVGVVELVVVSAALQLTQPAQVMRWYAASTVAQSRRFDV